MARLDYVDPATLPEDLQPLAARITAERSGRILNLYKMLLNSPPVADGWRAMGTAVRQKAILPGRYRELAICQVARLTRAAYEWHHHEPIARREGLSAEQLEALPDWRGKSCFDDREQAVLAYAEAVTRDIEVDDATFSAVRERFTPREIVELTATIGFYNLVARFLVALKIDIDGT